MHLENKHNGARVAPLEKLALRGAETGIVTVTDAHGREYFRANAAPRIEFIAGGAAGVHTVSCGDCSLQFILQPKTEIRDSGGTYQDLLGMLHYTMISEFGESHSVRWNGRIYKYFICWLRDHVHVMKGMKYFAGELQSGIDIYRESQREDGMIWDNIHSRPTNPTHWEQRFTEGGFIRPFDNLLHEFKRIPVENDVEYLFIEGLYFTWKATSDDGWMMQSLNAAMKALDYSVTDEYRWSEKYGLLKRGYTIDTWDFQNEFDRNEEGDIMRIRPGTTRFGVMFGDNTGYAMACDYLAEMLEHAGRKAKSQEYRERGAGIRERLNKLSWNGKHFTHHIRENPAPEYDFGVDESSQVSLSNAYSLNRGISQEQAANIIHTYQDIKANLPEGSPGEWYTIYPPFERGYGGHSDKWQYMNASVTPIVAGELAHGAFQHGFEQYGADILQRLIGLGKKHGGKFHACYTGAMPSPAPREFAPLDISPFANIDTAGTGANGVPGWTGEGDNDLHEMPTGAQTLAGIPWHVPDPASNGRRGAIGLWARDGYAKETIVPVQQKAGSIFFLHCASQVGPSGVVGKVTLTYDDGSEWSHYMVQGRNVVGWWYPTSPDARKAKRRTEVAWRGTNKQCLFVGVLAYGMDHPHPEKTIEKITLSAADDGAFWGVLGLTLCDKEAYFSPSPISFGIPHGWAAAAVTYALLEGLAGVVDKATAYNEVELSPRWAAAGVNGVSATVHYPDSGGYVSYFYRHNAEQQNLELWLTGSGEKCRVRLLLPEGAMSAENISVDGSKVDFVQEIVEQSHYAAFDVALPGPKQILVAYT